MTRDALLAWCGLISAVGAASGVIVVAVRWMLRTMKRLGALADDLLGEAERPGVPRRPGLMERVGAIEDRLGEVERVVCRELRPNGGSSIKDQVARIADR
ncbi:hypothetical protein EDC02_5951 [Micromonospora sp. Llam0]|uniref:hypothetical protein n=1 Tax=Micromonospora sp. Llam0 TaxID=2485143 RepID=UPI000FB5B552|nr:hypothetical protein [Micromonospora sp. Llam0]ROO51087.1 hypothetical protein EDC02_5951 [Micromonospora sp. Llam0]